MRRAAPFRRWAKCSRRKWAGRFPIIWANLPECGLGGPKNNELANPDRPERTDVSAPCVHSVFHHGDSLRTLRARAHDPYRGGRERRARRIAGAELEPEDAARSVSRSD